MRIPGYKTAKRYASWLRSRFYTGALVLGYHRVTEQEHDPYSLRVTPENFAEHLDIIRKLMTPVSLSDVVTGIRNGTVPRRAVAVTFDDGYVDNLEAATPLLERYGIPATIFVVAGRIGQEFWWETVARIIYSASALPTELVLVLDGWRYCRSIRPGHKQEKREGLVIDLYRRLRPLPSAHKQELITQLGDWACVPIDAQTSTRVLLLDELAKLASSELLEIGSHSLTHPILTAIPVESVQTEVQRSRALLEDVIGKPVTKFSYPDGATSRAVRAEVMSAGYTCACSSQYGVANKHSNLFSLPRIWPLDRNGEEFAHWIEIWASN